MRINRTFLFDEVKEAKKEYEKTEPITNFSAIELVAKYMYQVLSYKGEKLRSELINYCKSRAPSFNENLYYKEINRWIENAKKYNLRKINSITITESEYNTLANIKDSKERECLFYALIIAKAVKQSKLRRRSKNTTPSPNFYIKYRNLKDIAKFAGFRKVDGIEVAAILHNHLDKIYVYPPEKELIKLLYAEADGEPHYTITNFDNIKEEYRKIFSDFPEYFCERCGKEIEKTGKNQKYCSACAKEVRRERQRLIMQKTRDNSAKSKL
jgi:DNA-directed RNA polymerase subunit RPC12/RpoP